MAIVFGVFPGLLFTARVPGNFFLFGGGGGGNLFPTPEMVVVGVDSAVAEGAVPFWVGGRGRRWRILMVYKFVVPVE